MDETPHPLARERGRLSARSVRLKDELWSVPSGGGTWSSPAVASGVVYIGSQDVRGPGGFYALRASTGAVVWSISTGNFAHPASTANGVVYVTSGGAVLALSMASGAHLWSSGSFGLLHTPVIVNGALYVTTMGQLAAFDLP
jgi:outer membrane protein assembly factor BamB